MERIAFATGRVQELRVSAEARQSGFEEARLGVALTILEGHDIHAANFIDGITLRRRGELARVNRRIAGDLLADTTPLVIPGADRAA